MTTAANESSPTLQIPEKIDEDSGMDHFWHQYCQTIKEELRRARLDVERDYYYTIIHEDIKPANILLDEDLFDQDYYYTIIHEDFKLANILLDGNKYLPTYCWMDTKPQAEGNREPQAEGDREYHVFDDWLQNYGKCMDILYPDGKRDYSTITHRDIKPSNILLNGYMVPKMSDFGISKVLMEEQRTRTNKSYIGSKGHMAPEYRYNNLNKCDIYSLYVIIMEMLTGPTGYSNNREMSSQHFTQIMKIIIEIGLSFVDIIEYVFIIPFAHDILVLLNSGASLSAAVDVDKINLLLDSDGKASAAEPSVHQRHFFRSNLADERSDKPRSNRVPATNSSEETTHAPMGNKLTDDETENHSDPNSCVIERDSNEKEKRSAEWYIATGAAHHATWKRDLFSNMVVDLENDGRCVHAADGTPMPVCGRGDVVTDDVILPDVYYVPGLCTNLVSVGQLAGLDYCIGFGRGACVISNAAGAVVGRAHARGDGLYEVDFLRIPLSEA